MADIERSKTETEAMAEDLLMAETLPQSEEFPLPSSGIEWFLTRRQRNAALGQMLGRLFREHWRWNGDDPHYWSKQAQYLRENCRGRPKTRRQYILFGEKTISCASTVRDEVSDNLAAARAEETS